MFKFYLPINQESFKVPASYKFFLNGAICSYKAHLSNLLDINKCDCYDRWLIEFSGIENIENIVSNSHFSYRLLKYLINNVKYDLGEFKGVVFYFDIDSNNPFGKRLDIDKIFRLIEYGNGDHIPPYNLFNRALVTFRKDILYKLQNR